MNKKELPQFEGRRINNISTATLEWVDSKLTLAAVIARGSPIVHIVAFKHNENKFHHFYSVNVCPDLENPESLETNEGQTYTVLPAEVQLSVDSEFLAVIFFDGSVKVLKMPPILDPM